MPITNQQLAQDLLQIAKLAANYENAQPELQAVKDAAQKLEDTATAALSASLNADGSAPTDDQLNALADGNHALAQSIVARTQADQGGTAQQTS